MNQLLAYVHPGAKIADNVVVEPFATIHKDVEIGEGSWIGSNAVIMEGARIGKNVKIFPGAVISAVPQDLKFGGEQTTVEIGDNSTIRENVTINRGTNAAGKTVIGKNALVMANVHVAHDCMIGDHAILVTNVALAGHVIVGDWAIVGGQTPVHQFVHIGEHAMVSGGTLVRKDIPPFTKAGKEPMSFIGINSIGLRRRGFTSDQINHIQNVYRILFQQKLNTSQALFKIEAELEATPERDQIVTFIRESQRGIMRGYNNTKV